MNSLLRQYIASIISEMKRSHNVPNQLISKDRSSDNKNTGDDSDKRDRDTEREAEVEEHAIVGYSAPLGVSSADIGEDPTRPGERLKKNKKNFVRWK